jgi:hypothetical protein
MLGELPNAPTEELCEGAGLIPRIFLSLFERIAELEGAKRAGREVSFALSCSLLEIYKEQLTDLMAPSQRLVLREDKHGEVVVEGLSGHPVNCGEWKLCCTCWYAGQAALRRIHLPALCHEL